jgi:hypothetical protein
VAETDANIKVSVSQADASAAQLKKVAGGLTEVERSHERLGKTAGGKFESVGLKEMSKLILSQTIPGFERAQSAVVLMTTGIKSLFGSMAIGTGPVMAVIAAIGALGFVYKGATESTRKMREENEKNFQAHNELLKGYQDAERAGAKLTGASRDLYDSLIKLVPAERAVAVAALEKDVADKKALQTSAQTRQENQKAIWGLDKNKYYQDALRISNLRGIVALKQLETVLNAVKGGYKDDTDAIKESAAATERMNAAWAKAATARRSLETVRATDPRAKARIEIDALNSEFIASNAKLKKEAKSELEYLQEREALNQEYADRRRAIEEKAALEVRGVWRENLRVLEGPMTDFALRLPRAFSEGGTKARAAWKDFCNAVRDEAERLVAQKAVKAVLDWVVGGSGGTGGNKGGAVSVAGSTAGGFQQGGIVGGILGLLAGLWGQSESKQFGGYVAGPEGRPRIIVAHGGEKVTPAAATAATSGGNTTVNHFHGAVVAERQLIRAQRRSIGSRGELGLA